MSSTTDQHVVVDVYRDDFFLRRETIGGLPRTVSIGSDAGCRLWLDSSRVPRVAARLSIEEDGTTRLVGRAGDLAAGTALRFGPYVLVLVAGREPPPPGEPPRLLASVRAQMSPAPAIPDPGPAAQSCPRCAVPLTPSQPLPGAAAYRSAPVPVLACTACALLVLPAGAIAHSEGLAASPAVRKKKRASGLCPLCRDDLQGLVLSWEDDWVSVEQCGACRAIVVDRAEIELLRSITAAARGGDGA